MIQDPIIQIDSDDESTTPIHSLSQEETVVSKDNTKTGDVLSELLMHSSFSVKNYVPYIEGQPMHPMMSAQKIDQRFKGCKDDFTILSRCSPTSKMVPRPLTKTDLKVLIDNKGCLSDNTIMFYFFIVLQDRQRWMEAKKPSSTKFNSWAFITSHFMSSLLNVHNNDVNKRWTYDATEISIWNKKLNYNNLFGLLIPIHVGDFHWTLLKVEFSVKKITYIDSYLSSEDTKANSIMTAFIRHFEERLIKFPSKTPAIQPTEWNTIILPSEHVAQQQNGYDCGVFCCMYADFSMLNLPLTVDHTLATKYRRMMFNYIAAYVTNFGTE